MLDQSFFAFLNFILDAKMPNGTSKFNGSGDCKLYLVAVITLIFVLIGSNIWGIILNIVLLYSGCVNLLI